MVTVECETVTAVVHTVAPHMAEDSPDERTVHLAVDGGDGPWLTVSRGQYPGYLWPPRHGDVVLVTVPKIINAARYVTPIIREVYGE